MKEKREKTFRQKIDSLKDADDTATSGKIKTGFLSKAQSLLLLFLRARRDEKMRRIGPWINAVQVFLNCPMFFFFQTKTMQGNGRI